MLFTLSIIAMIPVMTALYYKVQLDNMKRDPQWVRATYLIDKPR